MRDDSAKAKTQDEGLVQRKRRGTLSECLVLFWSTIQSSRTGVRGISEA